MKDINQLRGDDLMFRKFYIPMILICLYLLISVSGVFAATRVEVLFYTGKIVVTNKDNKTKTFTLPQVVEKLPMDTIIECIDGIAIINVGEVQVSIGRKDKLKLFSRGRGDKVDIICLDGDIRVLSGENLFKIDKGQKLGLNKNGKLIVKNADRDVAPIREILVEQTKLISTVTLDEDPDEDIYASPHY